MISGLKKLKASIPQSGFYTQPSTHPSRGGFLKPIYTLRQALTLCAKLLRLKKLINSWSQSVKWLCAQLLAFMKSTQGLNFR